MDKWLFYLKYLVNVLFYKCPCYILTENMLAYFLWILDINQFAGLIFDSAG